MADYTISECFGDKRLTIKSYIYFHLLTLLYLRASRGLQLQ